MGCKQTADIRSTSALNIEIHAFFSKFREIDFTEKYVCMHYTLTQQFVILGIFFKSLFRFGISYSLTAFHSVTFSSQADTVRKKAKKKKLIGGKFHRIYIIYHFLTKIS